MNWINITEEKPNLNESIVLALNQAIISKLLFWKKKKKIAFGWLQEVNNTKGTIEYKFYDQTNNCFRNKAVTHWMSLRQTKKQNLIIEHNQKSGINA